jgi:molecular chaperone GrpE (heat shock protein)
MNNTRRKAIQSLLARLEDLKDELSALQEEEEDYRDNMPENQQWSERYEKADAACDNLSSAVDSLEEAIGCMEEAQE